MQTDEVDVHSAHPSTIFSLLYINSRLIAPAAAYRAAKPRCARAPYISPIAHAYARATYTTSITSRTVHLNLPRTAVAALPRDIEISVRRGAKRSAGNSTAARETAHSGVARQRGGRLAFVKR